MGSETINRNPISEPQPQPAYNRSTMNHKLWILNPQALPTPLSHLVRYDEARDIAV